MGAIPAGILGSESLTVGLSILLSVLSSVAINYTQVLTEISENRKANINREVESWYQRVISMGLRLRREALRLEYGKSVNLEGRRLTSKGEDVGKISDLIESLLQLHTEAPPEADPEILTDIEELGYWHDNADAENPHLDTAIIKTETQQRAEEIIDSAVENSKRAEDLPY